MLSVLALVSTAASKRLDDLSQKALRPQLVYNKYWCYGNCPVEARCLACSTSHSVGFSMPLTVKA